MKMRMFKAMAVLGLVLVSTTLGGCNAGNAPAEAAVAVEDTDRKQFVGTYELLSYITFGDNGTVTDMNYTGRIMYDEHGNMSAIGMLQEFPGRAAAESGGQQPRSGGFAYFGTWDLDPAESRVTHHVHGSPTNGAWPGTDLVRYYELAGDQLKLSIRSPEGRVTATLVWKRYP
jgi:hypothetical protein